MSRYRFTQMFVFAIYKQTGEEPTTEGYVLLPPAILRDCQEIVEFLERHVIVLKPNEEYPALKFATENGNYEMFEISLGGGGEITEETDTGDPMLVFYGYGTCEELLRSLLHAPFKYYGIKCPIHQRINDGGASSVEILTKILSGSVKLKYRTERGETFLHVATASDDTALLTLALQTCIGVDDQNDYGQSALHEATLWGHCNMVQLLLDKGANVNLADFKDETPIFYAMNNDYAEISLLLLNFGADINHANPQKETPLCCVRGHPTVSLTGQVLLDFDFNCVLETAYPDEYSPSMKIVVQKQAIKLSALGFKQLPIPVPCVDQADDFPRECEAEVARLKENRVGDTDITFYDIVTKGAYRNSCNVKNQNFTQVLQSDDFKSIFPIYASLIQCEFKKGYHRRKFLDRGVTAILSLAAKFSCLPVELIEEIIRFLTNEDILKMSL